MDCLWRATVNSDAMARFEVFKVGDTPVADVQTDLIGLDVTRVVAPLREKGLYASFPHLTPEVDFDGRRWIVRVQELASVTDGRSRPDDRADRQGTGRHPEGHRHPDPGLLSSPEVRIRGSAFLA